MPSAEHRFDAIGTPWRIDTPEPLGGDLTALIADRIDRFDRVYSRFRDDSLVSRIASTPGEWQFPPDAAPLFALYRTLYERTAGSVSPLVGARLESLGYDRAYSLKATSDSIPIPRWDEAFRWDGDRLTTARPVLIDVGAAGKGYLVDLVAGILADAGIDEYIVDASGDLVHHGATPMLVALENPRDATEAIGVYSLRNASLCASASNRRVWGEGLHHIIDAVTGQPTSRVIATWAVAPSALLADGLATALFFRDAGRLTGIARGVGDDLSSTSASANPAARVPVDFDPVDFDNVRMFSDGTVEYPHGLQGEIFREEAVR
jgi:thiamine biosynthesis lipoprotein